MNERGFTLLELMLVIAIMSLVLFAAVPKFVTSKEDFRLRSAARSCVSDIRYAQQLALDKKESHRILFNSGGYELADTETHELVKTGAFKGVTFEKIEDESGYEIGSGLVFDRTGKPFQEDGTDLIQKAKICLKAGTMYVFVYVTPSTGEVSYSWN